MPLASMEMWRRVVMTVLIQVDSFCLIAYYWKTSLNDSHFLWRVCKDRKRFSPTVSFVRLWKISSCIFCTTPSSKIWSLEQYLKIKQLKKQMAKNIWSNWTFISNISEAEYLFEIFSTIRVWFLRLFVKGYRSGTSVESSLSISMLLKTIPKPVSFKFRSAKSVI